MKAFKVRQIILFIFAVLLVLTPIVMFISEDGFSIGGFKVNFLTWERFMNPKHQEKKDISAIVTKVDTAEVSLKKHTNNSNGQLGAPEGFDFQDKGTTTLYLGDGAKINLYQFFTELTTASSQGKKIHIVHYGDSQIEGDRMTGYIRQRIQIQFGGYGPGIIPAMNVYNTISFKQSYSPNFKRYTCFGGSKLKSKKYGIMATSARFTDEVTDSISAAKMTSLKEAWIEIEPSSNAKSRAKTYNNVALLYNSCIAPCGLKVYKNNVLIHEDSLITDGKYHKITLSFESCPEKLKYVFSSTISPNICGFSLEGDYGVQVDNVAMRGCSGTVFESIHQGSLAEMYKDFNTELILLQFGGNSVPYFKDSSAVRGYAARFQAQLQAFQRLRPAAAILVIGPSDMSRYKGGIYETYPYLPYCVEQMRKAADNADAGYWDLYGAMGGINSMPAWVEKGLAGKDYIHFTPNGSSIASQLFYDAFETELARWKQKTK